MLPPAAINEGDPVTPRPSATVLLIRGRDPWQLLLMKRPGGADFAPDAYVFPGGSVHGDDRSFEDEIRAAAVRELFEEVGILLARRGKSFAREADCERVRGLTRRGTPFGVAVRDLALTPAFDRLVMLARWVTPAQLRRRFDARFLLARLPAGQTVHPQHGEVVDWLWTAPSDALRNPDLALVYATRAVLESVADARDVAALFSRARRLKDIQTVEPRIVQTADGWEVVR